MGSKTNSAGSKTRSSISIFIVVGLCCFFYILGAWQKGGFGKGDCIALKFTEQTDCSVLSNLNFETHHNDAVELSKALCELKNYRYKKMTTCISPLPEVSNPNDVAGGELKKFPDRLFAVPPRIALGYVPGVTAESYQVDNRLWRKHVNAYKNNKLIGSGRYRMMDMNAGLGGFAAALESPKSWVMNVVPAISEKNTLGVIYERGLIGIYHNWCEAFATYPRTYDLIHAYGVFSLYENKCKREDILLEMDRILRPEGTVIFHDDVDVLNKVWKVVSGMRWDAKMLDHEDGPLVPEKILVAVKQYWVGSNSTSDDE